VLLVSVNSARDGWHIIGAFVDHDPDLEVVIVSFRAWPLLRRCLQSLAEHLAPVVKTRVHVVDNASGDGTPDAVAQNFSTVTLHRRESNDGFAVANNSVLGSVEAPFVLVLNPDTELLPGAVEHLLDVMASDDRIGVLGCRLVQLDGSFDHAAKRSFPRPLDAVEYFLRRRGGGARYLAPHVGENEMGRVDAVNGAFMLIRTAAMRQVGLFDEAYWMYGEDLDWCKRFANMGWDVVYDGRVSVVHLKGGTSGGARSWKLNWHFHKSMAIFYRTHSSGKNLAVDGAVYLGIILRWITAVLQSTISRALHRRAGRR